MTNIVTKCDDARRLIESCWREFRAPAIMCSFGKDSLAMLHLVRGMGYELPVVFNREPWFPRKYAYANQLIAEWDLTVHDFPPATIALRENEQPTPTERIDFVCNWSFGSGLTLAGVMGARTPAPGEKYLCGLRDVLFRPRGSLQSSPWDVLLIGSKASDSKSAGNISALCYDIKRSPAGALAFPLRRWTDSDVWQYLEENGAPIDHGRYEKDSTGWHERADARGNVDLWPVCTRCMDKSNPASVHCPRLGHDVNNVAGSVPWDNRKLSEYFGQTTPDAAPGLTR